MCFDGCDHEREQFIVRAALAAAFILFPNFITSASVNTFLTSVGRMRTTIVVAVEIQLYAYLMDSCCSAIHHVLNSTVKSSRRPWSRHGALVRSHHLCGAASRQAMVVLRVASSQRKRTPPWSRFQRPSYSLHDAWSREWSS